MSLTSTGRHAADTDSWWSRRTKKGKVGIVTLALMALSGIAIAVFIVFTGTSGTVSGATYEVTLTGNFTQPTNADCTVSGTAGTTVFDLQWVGPVDGDLCNPQIGYQAPATNSGDLQLQSFQAPAGLVAEFDAATPCGLTLSPDSTVLPIIWFTFDGTVTDITFDPATHGIEWVRPAEYDPALCNATFTP